MAQRHSNISYNLALEERMRELAIEAELEEFEAAAAPSFGFDANPTHGVMQYVAWWSDGEDSRFCDN